MSDVEVKDFSRDVIERSASIPVLVDFWADWCGPCRLLGPVLEHAVEKFAGRVVLAKVDTDKNPRLSMQYGIRSIPAVKLFIDGDVRDEFTGAIPEPAVIRWLEKALPGRMQKDLDRAGELLAAGDGAGAERIARLVLDREPGNEHAAVILARVLVFDRPAEAARVLSAMEEHSPHFPFVEAIRTVARLHELTAHPAALPDAPVRASYLAGAAALVRRELLQAIDHFLDVLRTDRRYDDEGARKACIALFRLLGDDHEVTRARRRDFSSALNS